MGGDSPFLLIPMREQYESIKPNVHKQKRTFSLINIRLLGNTCSTAINPTKVARTAPLHPNCELLFIVTFVASPCPKQLVSLFVSIISEPDVYVHFVRVPNTVTVTSIHPMAVVCGPLLKLLIFIQGFYLLPLRGRQ